MTSDLIELIVPYFGDRARLEETVVSVLKQSSPQWRLIVVEDGDQGYDVGAWLAEIGDNRVRHVLNAENLGVAANFQRCLDLASAEFVTFPGCDDRLGRHYVREVGAAWRSSRQCSAVIPRVNVVDEQGLPARTTVDWVKDRLRPRARGVYAGESLMTSLMHGNWTYFPATSWRLDAIRPLGFRPDLPTTLDLALLSELILGGESVALLSEELFEYRRHRQSASSVAASDGGRFAEERALFSEIAERSRISAGVRPRGPLGGN